jgi:transcriptional regulator with PAS, ATPase and Fis domain
MTVQEVKQRFGIIGTTPELDRSIDIAMQVAPTDLSVLITGESGSGKEVFPQIIHQLSIRKHGQYIAVNCGAIPEGTIDSELFGHEKGSFTGAIDARKGYFEVANGGTIFLDEVAELPMSTQARLLRVLESGEFIKVGSSKTQKTDVRIIAATNVNVTEAISRGRFREDLYYRLNTVPVRIPPLRNRKSDISLLFRKFASDFAAKYRMPAVKLTPEAQHVLENYYFPGNIRQLKNITEQISVIERQREIGAEIIAGYLPNVNTTSGMLPVFSRQDGSNNSDFGDRELLYKLLIEMKKELNDVKKVVAEIVQGGLQSSPENNQILNKIFQDNQTIDLNGDLQVSQPYNVVHQSNYSRPIEVEESLSIQEKEKQLIYKALEKHRGKRKGAAKELGISERTLYRKIHEYEIKE